MLFGRFLDAFCIAVALQWTKRIFLNGLTAQAGVDIICAQGGEGGGHTGDVATSTSSDSEC